MNNQEYSVTIEETCVKSFKVHTSSSKEAIKIADESYRDGTFIVDGDSQVENVKIRAMDQNGNLTEWEDVDV